jgi:hypothetical protein
VLTLTSSPQTSAWRLIHCWSRPPIYLNCPGVSGKYLSLQGGCNNLFIDPHNDFKVRPIPHKGTNLVEFMRLIRFPFRIFHTPNSSSHIMALVSTQPLTEMSTRNLPGGKGRLAPMAHKFTAIWEPIVLKMWGPRRLTILSAFTACYRRSFTFVLLIRDIVKNRLIARQRLSKHVSTNTQHRSSVFCGSCCARCYAERTKHFSTMTDVFSMDPPRDYISSPIVNQNQISHSGREDSRRMRENENGVLGSHWLLSSCNWLWLRVIVKEAVNKSNYPIKNPLLLVTQP